MSYGLNVNRHNQYKIFKNHLAIARTPFDKSTLKRKSAIAVYREKLPTTDLPRAAAEEVHNAKFQNIYKPLLEHLDTAIAESPTRFMLDDAKIFDFELEGFAQIGFHSSANSVTGTTQHYPKTLGKNYKKLLPKRFPTQSKIEHQLIELSEQIRDG